MEPLKEGERPRPVTNADCFYAWRESPKGCKISGVREVIANVYDLGNSFYETQMEVEKKIKIFCMVVTKKWMKAGQSMDTFLKYNTTWLSQELELPEGLTRLSKGKPIPGPSTRGRKSKNFDDCSISTKRRKVKDLVKSHSSSELSLAHTMALRVEGQPQVAKLIENASIPTPEIPQELDGTKVLTDEQALALYLDLNLSESQYKLLQLTINNLHPNTFPSIHQLRKAKKLSYPPEESIKVTDTSAEVQLQALLDHTVLRIVESQEDVLRQISPLEELTMIYKWGFDGSSGHSTYKQKFVDSTSTDEFLLSIALVPLQLKRTSDGVIIWQNPRPGSTKYCRPVKFAFVKENADVVQSEFERLERLIENLTPSKVCFSGFNFSVKHDLHFTMVDGSICNIVSNTGSSSKCFICGAKPTEMNKTLEKVANAKNYRFGISSLHAWIRSFECLLHIAYRLPIKTWQVRGKVNKEIVSDTKKRIQTLFKSKLGLIVDKPKPGFGSTNDGNTARRFFRNPEICAEITGIDVSLIKKMATILSVISCHYDIDTEKFSDLLIQTKNLYLELYPWFYMPVTVHKILVHGIDIISSCILPIGQMSEESLEARHKEIRKIREHHTRKCSRESTNRDLFNLLLLTSDPKLSSRRISKQRQDPIPKEVLAYLKCPEPVAPAAASTGIFYINNEETLSDNDDFHDENFVNMSL